MKRELGNREFYLVGTGGEGRVGGMEGKRERETKTERGGGREEEGEGRGRDCLYEEECTEREKKNGGWRSAWLEGGDWEWVDHVS